MAGIADALKVFPAVWIPCPQFADNPCGDDVVYMTLRCGLFRLHASRFHFTISTKSSRSMIAPPSSIRRCARPSTVHSFPTHWLFLGHKFCLTELTAAVTVCVAAKTFGYEDFCLAILAVGTTHDYGPPFTRGDRSNRTGVDADTGSDKGPYLGCDSFATGLN